ncbi:MAG: glycosyltransferase [Actinobacteria bacterium]|nr:glycosyltransferase [Actinomycetota bacterium]
MKLRCDMRKLWEDHVMWTRVVIISAAASLDDTNAAVDRLMKNQEDIGNAIKPYYGNAAGDKLIKLLKEHISGAYEVLTAAKAGNQDKLKTENQKWYSNADEISAFLSGANPKNWPLDAVKKMMKMHLDLTLEEAVARLKGDWAADVKAYDKVHDEILEMSDAITDGIMAQFPEKFKEVMKKSA